MTAELGETKGTLDARIQKLTERGDITTRTVDALDAVRVVGNKAVHAGANRPDGGDDVGVVFLLFRVVNDIVENAISLPKRTQALRGDRQRSPSGPESG